MNARKRRIEAEQRLYNIQQGKVQKPDVYGSRKKPPVVKNNDQDDEFFENVNDDNLVINSDAVSAAEYLIKINPRSSIPICFVHQIYSILPNNNTVTDRELVSRRERVYTTHTILILHELYSNRHLQVVPGENFTSLVPWTMNMFL